MGVRSAIFKTNRAIFDVIFLLLWFIIMMLVLKFMAPALLVYVGKKFEEMFQTFIDVAAGTTPMDTMPAARHEE